jgi:thiol-disulfide isomerase/thioredoxin
LSIDEKRLGIITELCDRINLNNRKTDSVKKAFFIKHPSSFVSLWAMYTGIWSLENLDLVTECFKYLDNKLRNSKAGQKLAKRIEGQMNFLNGQIFPDMQIADSAGKKLTIQENIKGKYTLIDFWFSHCGPCIVQFPLIRNLYTQYKDAGFDVIGISVDKSADKKDWLDAIAKHKLNWSQYWDVDKKEVNRFFIDTYPTNFLLDSEGKIIKKNILIEELEIMLAKNLK